MKQAKQSEQQEPTSNPQPSPNGKPDLSELIAQDKREREAEFQIELDALAKRLRVALVPVVVLRQGTVEAGLEIRAQD